MHVVLPKQALLQSIQRCQNIVERRHTIPILANILMEADEGALHLTATDMEVCLRTKVSADVRQLGNITVSARTLFNILKELSNDHDVDISVDQHFMHIKSGLSKFRLATLPAEDFPAVQEEQTDMEALKIAGADLSKMIAATSFAISNDETRKHLTGILFEVDAHSRLRLVTTDGHRLAMTYTKLDQPLSEARIIVPRKTVLEIKHLCEEEQGLVELRFGERQLRLKAGEHCLTSKLIDARFPNYEDVLPSGNEIHLSLDRAMFDQTLKRIMFVANEFTHDIGFQLSEGQLKLSAHNAEQEEAVESIAVEYSGEDVAIGFNALFLRDVLSVMNASQVCMELQDCQSPALLLEEGNEVSRYVVMPMRM